MTAVILTDVVASPLGDMLLMMKDDKLIGLEFDDRPERIALDLKRRFGAHERRPAHDPSGLSSRLRAYFAGDFAAIGGIETDGGGTPFQERVWTELKRIPLGTTISYGELARRLRDPNATRAVGLANGRNPISIVVPCHRVIGSDGTLTGYGGGLHRKTWLLAHEGIQLRDGRVERQRDLFGC